MIGEKESGYTDNKVKAHLQVGAGTHAVRKTERHLRVSQWPLAIAVFLVFSLLYHGFFLFTPNLFALHNRDSVLQDLYFVSFLQKAFLSGRFDWSWSYGLGGGVLGGFSFYYSTSPFFYLMLFIRSLGIGTWNFINLTEWKMAFSIVKQCLMMLFMFALLRHEGKKTYSSLIAAVCYGGSILFLRYTVAFDFMVESYIWVPLTVLGFRVYQKSKKPWIMLTGLTLTAVNSFYFAFFSFVFYVLFLLVFAPANGVPSAGRVRSLFRYLKNYFLFALLSLGIAAVLLVPSVFAFLSCDRFNKTISIPALFPASFYLQFPENFFGAYVFGLPVLLLLLVFIPWKSLSGHTKRKTALAAVWLLFYLIPVCGSAIAGFSYTTDRWAYLLIFSFAYLLPDLLEENDRHRYAGYRLLFLYIGLFALCAVTRKMRGLQDAGWLDFIPMLFCSVSLLMVALKKRMGNAKTLKRLNAALTSCVLSALLLNSLIYSLAAFTPETAESIKSSELQNTDASALYSSLTPNGTDFYRTLSRDAEFENDSLQYSYYGASAYNSLIDVNISQWMRLRYNVLERFVCVNRFQNFDDRLFLESAFGVKYITTKREDDFQPFGFALKEQTPDYHVYENSLSLGMDLWYENAASESDFRTWNTAQRDAMLLQTAVLPGAASESYKSADISDVTTELNTDWGAGRFTNAGIRNGVLYAEDRASFEVPIQNTCKSTSGEILVHFTLKPLDGRALKVSVNGKETLKPEENGNWTYPTTDYVFRLDGNTDVIHFAITPGNYQLKDWNVWFNSYTQYPNWIQELNQYNLQNLHVDGGSVSGTFENQTRGILALNIPYCNGWKAFVNGKPHAIIKVNGAFTGLQLNPGKYQISLRYQTPGLIPGMLISGCSAGILAAFFIIRRRNSHAAAKPEFPHSDSLKRF